MEKNRQRKLEAAGFVVGDAQQFLELGDAEMAMIELRVALARALRHRRHHELGVSQAEFARRVGSSQSRVAKMEAGDPSVTLDLLIKSLITSGVTAAEIGHIVGETKRSSVGAHRGG